MGSRLAAAFAGASLLFVGGAAFGAEGDGFGFGGIGVAIPRSSVTVTDLKPFSIN